MATTKGQGGAMCCVTIGYQHFLLPADKGMRVLEAMQHAVGCERNYDHDEGERFFANDPPRINYELVRASQVHLPEGQVQPAARRRRATRAISDNPTPRLEFKS
ncbi:hypothetical protein ACOTJH_29120 [Achromobacter xylosoxidans]